MGQLPTQKPRYTSSGMRIPSRTSSPSPSRSPSRSETTHSGASGTAAACFKRPVYRECMMFCSSVGHAAVNVPRPAPKMERSASASPAAMMMSNRLVDCNLSVHDQVFPYLCLLVHALLQRLSLPSHAHHSRARASCALRLTPNCRSCLQEARRLDCMPRPPPATEMGQPCAYAHMHALSHVCGCATTQF